LTFFLLLCGYFMLRPIRGAVASANSDILQWLYTATFTGMLVLVPVFGYLVARYPRRLFLPAIYGFVVICLLWFAWEFRGGNASAWVQRGFYVWLSVINLMMVSVFWSFMADIFRPGQGQRLFGFITAGGALGAVIGPLVTALMVKSLGTSTIMLIATTFFIAVIFMVVYIGRMPTPSIQANQDKLIGGSVWEGAKRVFQSKYLIFACLLMLLHNATSVFLYNGLAMLVNDAIPDFDQAARFYGMIDIIVQLIAFTLQFFITLRLVRVFGMHGTLMAVPLVLAAGLAVLGSMLTLTLFVAVGVAQRSLNYGVLGPTKEMLFTVVDRETKYKCKNFIDTAIYRGSDVSASWIFKGLTSAGLSLGSIAWLFLPVVLAWSMIGWQLGKIYRQLKDHVQASVVDGPAVDAG
jgi:AAA family ATP:ADP antiporter